MLYRGPPGHAGVPMSGSVLFLFSPGPVSSSGTEFEIGQLKKKSEHIKSGTRHPMQGPGRPGVDPGSSAKRWVWIYVPPPL